MSGGQDVSIDDYTFKFPYEPYEEQKEFMRKVLKSLDNKQNAYLESPTGTGKTLSLLFSTLAWVKKEAGKRKIIYAVKSNTAKSDALKEFKKLSMEMRIKNIKAISIASRDINSCLHKEIKMKGEFVSYHCKKMIKPVRKCKHYFTKDEKKDCFQYFESDANGSQIVDIEDIAKTINPEHSNKCPYFVSREMIKTADIIFMPCDYLWDQHIRAYLENSILLLDDGHNFKDKCVEMASAEFKYDDLEDCIKAFERKEWAKELELLNTEAKNSIKKTLENMRPKINEDQSCNSEFNFEQKSHEKNVYEKVFNTNIANINEENFENIISGIKAILDIFIPKLEKLESSNENYKFIKALVVCLENLKRITRMMFVDKDFNTHKDKVNKFCRGCHLDVKNYGKMFYLYSFPAIAVSFLPKFHSIILASATLYGDPYNSVEEWKEMGINFDIKRKFKATFMRNQVCVEVFTHSKHDKELDLRSKHQDNMDCLKPLVETVFSILSVIKGKAILFFPSYKFLKKFSDLEDWKNLTEKNNRDTILITTKDPRETANQNIEKFQKKVDDTILMTECSGKIAEGLNFPNCSVILFGLPYLKLSDPRSDVLKIIDKKKWQKEYDFQAILRIMQAKGRVNRNENDRAAIILCDYRFKHCDFLRTQDDSFKTSFLQAFPGVQEKLCSTDAEKKFEAKIRKIEKFFTGSGNSRKRDARLLATAAANTDSSRPAPAKIQSLESDTDTNTVGSRQREYLSLESFWGNANNKLRVYIVNRGPKGYISESMFYSIQEQIQDPGISSIELYESKMYMVCDNDSTLESLNEKIRNMPQDTGSNIQVFRLTRAQVFVPGPIEHVESVLQKITIHNNNLRLNEWLVVQVTPKAKGQWIHLGIDPDSAEILRANEGRIFYPNQHNNRIGMLFP